MFPLAIFFEPNSVRGWLNTGGYGALFGLLLSCGLGVPIPETSPLSPPEFSLLNTSGIWQ